VTYPAMSPQEEQCEFLLAAARLLHENGEETQGTLAAVQRLCAHLGMKATLIPAWNEIFLQVEGERVRASAVTPSNINMNRVVTTLEVVEATCAGRLNTTEAKAALANAGHAPESGLLLFVFACTIGAGALSVINGASHFAALSLVMLCAAVGALVRKGLAAWLSANSFLQIFAASLLAGGVGAAGVAWHVSSAMRLVALGPLLVLVPGPAILGGAFDLAALRLPLGAARLGFGLLTILAICTGVLLGLGGTTLPPTVESRTVPLWADVLCAGIAAAAYGVFFAMPLRMLGYPALMGMLAHTVRWGMISGLGLSNAAGAGIACLLVGSVLVPVARRLRLPFAAVGFASVVSMVPGIFLFRMGGGLMQIQKEAGAAPLPLIGGVLSDAATALATVIAMTVGLVLPIAAYTHFRRKGKNHAV